MNVLVGVGALTVTLLASVVAWSQQGSGAPRTEAAPDESVLGTIEVNGSAGTAPPLPKLGILPLIRSVDADAIARGVLRGDLTLSGEFDVVDDSKAPSGPFEPDMPIDFTAWRKVGAEYVVRAYSRQKKQALGQTELVGEVYLTSSPTGSRDASTGSGEAGATTAGAQKPAYQTAVPVEGTEYRVASHRLVDSLLGVMTGRPGGFTSKMVYVGNTGTWRSMFVLDSDGFDLHGYGPAHATIVSPAFGPGGVLFYAISVDYSPFRIAFGPAATPAPFPVAGSVLGLAFSADRTRMAVTIMDHGASQVVVANGGQVERVASDPFANHPTFGPMGKLAYVAGASVQRVFVDGKPISPSGFMASTPVFCDTPMGLLVFYSVRVGSGSDIVASTVTGSGIRRFTQQRGSNVSPACSPDGRLIAFFSTGGGRKEPGLYVMPIARPWLMKKISSLVGDSLRWETMIAAPRSAEASGGKK